MRCRQFLPSRARARQKLPGWSAKSGWDSENPRNGSCVGLKIRLFSSSRWRGGLPRLALSSGAGGRRGEALHDHAIDLDQGLDVFLATDHRAGVTPNPDRQRDDRGAQGLRQTISRVDAVFAQGRPHATVPIQRVNTRGDILWIDLGRLHQRQGDLCEEAIFHLAGAFRPGRRPMVRLKGHSPAFRPRIP